MRVLPEIESTMVAFWKAGLVPTADAVHAALGARVSLATVIRVMAEVIAAAATREDYERSREGWEVLKLVVKEKPKKKGPDIEQMRRALAALIAESQGFLEVPTEAVDTIARLEAERERLVTELKQCKIQLATMREAVEQNADRPSLSEREHETEQAIICKTLGL